MQYSVFEREMVGGEYSKYNASFSDVLSAKKQFHNKIAAAYATEGIQYVMCMVINDLGGIEAKEVYQRSSTVTFNGNGGEGEMISQIFQAITPQSLLENTFVFEGKNFIGWSTDASATTVEYTDGQIVEINDDLTLYAVWSE